MYEAQDGVRSDQLEAMNTFAQDSRLTGPFVPGDTIPINSVSFRRQLQRNGAKLSVGSHCGSARGKNDSPSEHERAQYPSVDKITSTLSSLPRC